MVVDGRTELKYVSDYEKNRECTPIDNPMATYTMSNTRIQLEQYYRIVMEFSPILSLEPRSIQKNMLKKKMLDPYRTTRCIDLPGMFCEGIP